LISGCSETAVTVGFNYAAATATMYDTGDVKYHSNGR